MATELPTTNGQDAQDGETNFAVKAGLARMLKGGVIMDVVNAEQVCLHPVPLHNCFSASSLLAQYPVQDLVLILLYRPALLKKLAPRPSWPSSACPLISVPKAA